MRRAFWAAAALLSLTAPVNVIADGYGLGPYHWVHPPYWQRLTNIEPSGTIQTVSLSQPYQIVSTPDAQVSIEINKPYSFGRPPGQTGIRVAIEPLARYHLPRHRRRKLDGNVYATGFHYEPSGAVVRRARIPILMTLDAPHNTPSNVMMGRFGRKWKVICTLENGFLAAGLPSCLTKRLPSRVAVFYLPSSHYSGGKTSSGKGSQISPFILAAIVIVGLWAALILFLLLRNFWPNVKRQMTRNK